MMLLHQIPGTPVTLISFLLVLLTRFTAAQSPYPTTTSTTNTTASNTTSSTSSPSPTTAALQIEDGSGSTYAYVGCWNESAGLPGTTGLRALDGGSSRVLPGEMTVSRCLAFCAAGGDSATHARRPYRLAGLEYSRECWCGDKLSSLSVLLPDAACDTPCDGANATACGGALKLTLYNSTLDFADENAAALFSRGGGAAAAWAAVTTGLWLLVAGLSLGDL
ncbi:putative WSC domain-containing protein [Rosellinia necatrix]|uniref:Putative WSC domain-containing protein n=1 Tax=Rosellinia necatrix TaxID=77044 RepID=A0A1W2TDA8_ROSNE|nr:putative WSC domain-containing protein [Rosellinia necatrix]